jgi:hypothetical protein
MLPPANLQGGVSTLDAYGNAQFDLPERRELGVFQTTSEWEALGAYQLLNRRTDSRGGSTYFALPGDVLGLSTMGTLADAASPAILADVTPRQRVAFMQYGGFGDRLSPASEDQISGAFQRRHRLITANMAYAPVYRAIMENSSFAGLRPLVTTTPFMESDTPARPEAAPAEESLYNMLRTDSTAAHRRTTREAWLLFEEGQYRHAAREFESALTIEPNDAAARTGEIFCYVAVGAIQTAAVLVNKLNAIDENPFKHQAQALEGFSRGELAQGLLRDSRLAVDSIDAGKHPSITAVHLFVLWHLGERDAALRAARGLARAPEAAAYKEWPAKMEAARAALSTSTSR